MVISILVILALMTAGVLLSKGLIPNKPHSSIEKKGGESSILGEASVVSPTAANEVSINNLLQNTLTETKNVVSEKVTETKNNIINNIQKEISALTETQVQTLKMQICKDWGLLSASPTPSPKL